MKIENEILIRAKIINYDANPHGSSIKVRVDGLLEDDIRSPGNKSVEF